MAFDEILSLRVNRSQIGATYHTEHIVWPFSHSHVKAKNEFLAKFQNEMVLNLLVDTFVGRTIFCAGFSSFYNGWFQDSVECLAGDAQRAFLFHVVHNFRLLPRFSVLSPSLDLLSSMKSIEFFVNYLFEEKHSDSTVFWFSDRHIQSLNNSIKNEINRAKNVNLPKSFIAVAFSLVENVFFWKNRDLFVAFKRTEGLAGASSLVGTIILVKYFDLFFECAWVWDVCGLWMLGFKMLEFISVNVHSMIPISISISIPN